MDQHQAVPDQAGLATPQAVALRARIGANAIADIRPHLILDALRKFWAPVPWLLEAAIVLQLVLGDFAEAGIVGLLLVFNAALGLIQEGRAQATLDALRSRLALVAAVRRDGVWTTLPAADLVPGDVVKLSLGGVVAADVQLLAGSVLLDQSMLTGESVPVEAGAGVQAYAGALVRRGEAVAVVTATGERTKFGGTAALIRNARVESSEQKTVLRVVRNLVLMNGGITVLLGVYAVLMSLPVREIVPLLLVAVLSSIPVALPSMFTLAASVGARALGRQGVLPTRLSAVDEAAGIDILCCDKTGTLTRNELAVTSVGLMPGYDESQVLRLAALASSEGGQDPVDAAIRLAAAKTPNRQALQLLAFEPFDPETKRSGASVRRSDGSTLRIVKGAFSVVAGLAQPAPAAAAIVDAFQTQGFRVLAVASGKEGAMTLAGFIALSDPPRDDSPALIARLKDLGVRTIMLTGDAPATALVVGNAIGITGKIWSTPPLTADLDATGYAIFAGVLPEDKYCLVQALQRAGHVVGMCGDGANDAPALRQAQMGIAVSTATDVAKSAAGIVLTEPGLAGILVLIREGRVTFQRILTYVLRSIVHKVVQVLFLAVGLLITGHAILTPMLMVLMMVTGDFLSMSSSTDNVRPSPRPNVWRIRNLSFAAVIMGLFDLGFCVACLSVGRFMLHLDVGRLQTLTVVTLVFSGQAVFYVSRERQHLWSSMPGKWLIISSIVDLGIISTLATTGTLMRALPWEVIGGVLGAVLVFVFILDAVKIALFRHLAVA